MITADDATLFKDEVSWLQKVNNIVTIVICGKNLSNTSFYYKQLPVGLRPWMAVYSTGKITYSTVNAASNASIDRTGKIFIAGPANENVTILLTYPAYY